jgi:hypothetical protein
LSTDTTKATRGDPASSVASTMIGIATVSAERELRSPLAARGSGSSSSTRRPARSGPPPILEIDRTSPSALVNRRSEAGGE